MSDTYFIKNLECAYCGEKNDFGEEALAFGHKCKQYYEKGIK